MAANLNASLGTVLEQIGADVAFETLASLYPEAAVFMVDGDRNVLFWSDGAEQLLGTSAAAVEGRLCLAGIRCRSCLAHCGLAEKRVINGDLVELLRPDGEVVRLRKFARAFSGNDGGFGGGIELLVAEDSSAGSEQQEPEPGESAELFDGLASRDPAMQLVFQTIRNVAETDATVLIRGESGTGKELVARALHAESHRRDGPFVAVNCAALTPTLIESELFGHRKGAFTGAVSDHQGIFLQAHGGTLLLDEVAELPLAVQAKLLRVLEQRVVVPVGGSREIAVDVRIVAATHRALRQEVKLGTFREDLMYRLRVVPLFLPALRERRGDVELLLRHLLKEFNDRGPRQVDHIAPDAMQALLDYSWPGNIRELRNVVEYAFAVGRGGEIKLTQLPPEFREGGVRLAAEPAGVSEAERISSALRQSGGRVGDAAELLGMSRPTFWRRRKKYGL